MERRLPMESYCRIGIIFQSFRFVGVVVSKKAKALVVELLKKDYAHRDLPIFGPGGKSHFCWVKDATAFGFLEPIGKDLSRIAIALYF